jgi:hypothetical protein
MRVKDSKLKGSKTPLKIENFEEGWGEERDAILEKIKIKGNSEQKDNSTQKGQHDPKK